MAKGRKFILKIPREIIPHKTEELFSYMPGFFWSPFGNHSDCVRTVCVSWGTDSHPGFPKMGRAVKAAYFWIAVDVNIGRRAQSKRCFEINPSFLCHMSFRPRRAEWALSKICSSAWPAGSHFQVLSTSSFSSLAQYCINNTWPGPCSPRPANWLIKKGTLSNQQTCSSRETCSVLEPRSRLC